MTEIFVALVLFALGYAFRGAIGRELKTIVPDVKKEFAIVVADFKADLVKVVADVKSKV